MRLLILAEGFIPLFPSIGCLCKTLIVSDRMASNAILNVLPTNFVIVETEKAKLNLSDLDTFSGNLSFL